MADEKWQKIREVFDSALRRQPDERRMFVNEACGQDKTLLAEVESLLSSFDSAESFMETPAVAEVADVIQAKQKNLEAGKCFGHYEIIEQIGEGGMGKVYLAKDKKLDRKVAVKILNQEFSRDESSLTRFIREAKAASSLNHPNILVVHEIGEHENTNYIVSEFINGKTLRQLLKEKPLKLSEVLDISIPIADALCTAHASNIIHRDIKPDNVMIRPDGLVKILDFGIAKLTEKKTQLIDAEAATAIHTGTSPGMIIGTAAYMSPEQARGKAVDARSDIFSFGLVLYEMLSGKKAFAGENALDVISSILQKEPIPLSRLMPDVPHEIECIVGKALRKDCDERYQTATDLLIDLKDARQELQFEAKLERHKFKDSAALADGFNFHQNAEAETHILEVDTTAKAIDEAATTNIAEYSTAKLTGQFKRIFSTRRAVIYAAVSVTLLLGAFAYLWYWRQTSVAPQSEIKSLAVLPLKSLNRGAGDDYLGLGIADTIITKVSQVGGLTVRPTSAVRKYADQEIDSLEAARQLQADSVLDGTFLHAGDRLRLSVNLLRVRDGASLWAESFDMRFTDIFTIQDEVSKQVVARLRLKLSPTEQARLAKRHTTNPEAYSYYTKAMYHFSKRSFGGDPQEETDTAIDLLKKAIELDPNYALAHAQLGYAYAWIADFNERGPSLIASAKEELRVAERLDPQLAEVHIARSFFFWSNYEDWQIEAAIREGRLAKQLDPSIPNQELGSLYWHVGLEEQAAKEFEWALEQDPTNGYVKSTYRSMYSHLARPDEWLAINQRLFSHAPGIRYYLDKRMLKEAAPLIEQEYVKNPAEPGPRRDKALLLALQGKHREAQASVPRIMEKVRRDKRYHHITYDIARIYALDGQSEEALKWLRITVKEGFPCYTLFARDSFLDPIRRAPAFMQFMAEMKTRWEGYQREFG